MEKYKMLMEINRKQMVGEEISDAEKKEVVFVVPVWQPESVCCGLLL